MSEVASVSPSNGKLVILRRPRWLAVGIVLCLLAAVLSLSFWWARNAALELVRQEGVGKLTLFLQNLHSTLSKFESLPQVLARDPRIIELLLQPDSEGRIRAGNRYLQDINHIAGAAAIYAIDQHGLTLAASNWDSPTPFVGRNFAFRPYFQAAIRGEFGKYPALGTTSNKRGYYYAYPVAHDDDIIGVVVVKVGVDEIETAWLGMPDRYIVSDTNGVVFITNHPDWRFKLLQDLAPDKLRAIRASRQYADAELVPLPITQRRVYDNGATLLAISEARGHREQPRIVTYLAQQVDMAAYAWRVYILSDISRIWPQVGSTVAIIALALIIIGLGGTIAWQRRRAWRQQLFHQQEIERSLRIAHDELEHRVRQRTGELVETNRRLDLEVQDHKRAEEELRQAQDGLIQSAKLATLGRMSAGITHELNQPLTALRSFLDNAKVLLVRQRYADVAANVDKMDSLTERMAQLTQQLKTFARHTSDSDIQSVALLDKLDNALALVSHGRNPDFQITWLKPPQPIQVLAEPVRLEQVLINILQNALDAMHDQQKRRLSLSLDVLPLTVCLQIRDNGPGIDPTLLPTIFEPFTTSKQVGEGLGLGLSISSSIMQSFGGGIGATNPVAGGAEFAVTLRRADKSS